jgi:multisubunit Na+/H+ antiporter MnhG subunit
MDWLIWIGSAFSLGGVLGLVRCIQLATRARRAGLDEAAMRARLQQIVTYNLAALGVSTLGLMMVILGIFLA